MQNSSKSLKSQKSENPKIPKNVKNVKNDKNELFEFWQKMTQKCKNREKSKKRPLKSILRVENRGQGSQNRGQNPQNRVLDPQNRFFGSKSQNVAKMTPQNYKNRKKWHPKIAKKWTQFWTRFWASFLRLDLGRRVFRRHFYLKSGPEITSKINQKSSKNRIFGQNFKNFFPKN